MNKPDSSGSPRFFFEALAYSGTDLILKISPAFLDINTILRSIAKHLLVTMVQLFLPACSQMYKALTLKTGRALHVNSVYIAYFFGI